ncbi:hypothetical protein NLI96_g6129 [Meripilus lineatus]|uniref:Acyl-CoA desaturase n=1 Tax=Meripilus lineatus TaxID=2056292 RepID=A0AAD5V1N2_9APHY|nr:hypothetical protein NLI96_g6129 [Physisporinus lineatus]
MVMSVEHSQAPATQNSEGNARHSPALKRRCPSFFISLLHRLLGPPTKFNVLRSWIRQIIWFNLLTVLTTPLLSLYGVLTTTSNSNTIFFSIAYYILNMIGVTAGKFAQGLISYTASKPLELFLAVVGAGSVQGSIKWWCRHHRAHHRYTDTHLDPYGGHHGFWWSHIGWMLVESKAKPGQVEIDDLKRNPIVAWQHRWFFHLAAVFGLLLPAAIPGCLWGDWRGGLFFAGLLRLTCVHHSIFCVNSLAHWLGEASFDDKLTPRDHFFTALVTLGEGYHNFHHQFPMDYRNAVKWYQWDPTKWFIACCEILGLASHLQRSPDGEIRKSQFTMQVKQLKEVQDDISWPLTSDELPVIEWSDFQEQSEKRPLILVAGFIHDVEDFAGRHPGGEKLVRKYVGKDATTAFVGGVYDHSNAARNSDLGKLALLDWVSSTRRHRKLELRGRLSMALSKDK